MRRQSRGEKFHLLGSLTSGLLLTVAITVSPAGMPPAAQANTVLHGEISDSNNSNVNSIGVHPMPQAAAAQIEIDHQRTLGMRDIGEISADLQQAQATYEREEELVNEGIAPRKDLEAAEAVYKKKQIDLAARKATMAQDEAAILRKHHLPSAKPPVFGSEQLNAILRSGHNTHSYAEVRPWEPAPQN